MSIAWRTSGYAKASVNRTPRCVGLESMRKASDLGLNPPPPLLRSFHSRDRVASGAPTSSPQKTRAKSGQHLGQRCNSQAAKLSRAFGTTPGAEK